MSNLKNHLVIFIKVPRMGMVKTRLARDIGNIKACNFYRFLVSKVLKLLGSDKRWYRWVALTPNNQKLPKNLVHGKWHFIKQGFGDLGERMNYLMQSLPPGPVVIIGSDIPSIKKHHIEKAFFHLGSNDAVFGPSIDGGFWLVGLKRRPNVPNIFTNVRWSSIYALSDTLKNLDKKMKIKILERLEDIDDGSSFNRWQKNIP